MTETEGVKPGMFSGNAAPKAAMPVAGPGVPEKTTAPTPAAAAEPTATAARKRIAAAPRKPAPKKKAKAKAKKKHTAAIGPRGSRASRPAPAPQTTAAPRRGRVAAIKLDMQTMFDVLGSTKKKDQQALYAIVSALNPLSKPQRVRVMEAVARLLTA